MGCILARSRAWPAAGSTAQASGRWRGTRPLVGDLSAVVGGERSRRRATRPRRAATLVLVNRRRSDSCLPAPSILPAVADSWVGWWLRCRWTARGREPCWLRRCRCSPTSICPSRRPTSPPTAAGSWVDLPWQPCQEEPL
jgi:hypothetical protein